MYSSLLIHSCELLHKIINKVEMTQYINAFLTLNLGVEMVYVVAQRLNAQNIPLDRSTIVLNDIISVLVSKELIADIMKPQASYTQETIRNIIGNVAQSSIMKLDTVSMDKLWDLITMIFKWQATFGSDILKITARHVNELENYVTNAETLLQLRRVENLADNFGKIFDKKELRQVRQDILNWLDNCNVKVSLLLKMGLQDTDGVFIIDKESEFVKGLQENLGQNIYSLKDADRICEKKSAETITSNNEIDVFVDQILGKEKNNSENMKRSFLRLNIASGYSNSNNPIASNLKNIKSRAACSDDNFQIFKMKGNHSKLNDLLADLNMNDKDLAGDNNCNVDFKDDLLKLMNNEDKSV